MSTRTRFVGRARELGQLQSWLRDAAAVTIVGGAGIGKSRLAREVAARWRGVTYEVDLAHETGGEGCTARLARELELSSNASSADVGRALSQLENPLLVFDDADPVVEALAGLLAEWLESAPDLRVLTTSRERLRIRSEQTLELGPLSLDGGAQSEAALLFADRVAQVAPQAVLDETNLQSWCQWLEGIPLAIELAAARAPLLGEVGDERRLDVLTDGFRDADSRHSTLARAIEWSWSLLDETEQQLLAESSAFAGRFHVGATTRVLHRPTDGRRTMEVVRALVDKSFVRLAPDGRLELFDAVREFVSEALPEMRAKACERLDAYLASQAQHDAGGAEALREDVLAAANRVVRGESALGANASAWILVYAGKILASEGPATELAGLMQRGLELLPDAHVDLRTQLRIAWASGLRMQGSLEQAAATAEKALADEPKLLDEVRTQLLIELALSKHGQRDLEEASQLYDRALSIAPSRRTEGRLHANLGAIAHDRGELDLAEASYRKALVALGVTEDRRLIGVVRSNLALLFQERGDLVLAQETLEQALSELDEAGERYLGAIHRSNLGQLHLELEDAEQALREHELALPELRRIGDARSVVLCLARRGASYALAGQLREASRDFEDASSRAHHDPLLGAVVALHAAFEPLSRALSAEDEAERAKRVQACRTVLADVEHSDADWRLSDDARAAMRMIQTHLGRLSEHRSELPEDAITVGIESRFFRVPGGEWQDLRRQTAARRILEHLVTRHGKQAATMADLQAAAWPGERIRKDAATNRIHVALSKLRQKGLKPFLTRDDEGYRLDPTIPIHRLAQTTPPEG